MATAATRRQPVGRPPRAARHSTYQHAEIHSHTRLISSPDVAKSQTTATDDHGDPRTVAAPASPAARTGPTKAATAATSPSSTAIHSMARNHPSSRRPIASTAIHSGLVPASMRSPALNTGPWPAKRLSTTRKLMKASSLFHRCAQPPTAIINAGT